MKKALLLFCMFAATVFTFAQTTHTVEKGDNPYRISKIYNIPLERIYELNPEIKNNPLSIGQVVILRKKENYGSIIIEPKQTIYGITTQYHISEEKLRELNPNLDNSMKIGDKVLLPLAKIEKYANGQKFIVEEIAENSSVPVHTDNTSQPVEKTYKMSHVSSDNYLIYKVKGGDTLFGIVGAFDVSVDQLISANPILSKGLQPGIELKIKQLPKSYSKKTPGPLNVTLILPFGYINNDDKYREIALGFLKGARYALEANAKSGKKINAKIIDGGTGDNFSQALAKIDKSNTDLIIGPLFKGSLVEVLEHVKLEQIPVVAPFANSEDLFDYSNLVILTIKDQEYAERIAQEVIQDNNSQKIYIVSDNKYGSYIKNEINKKLPNVPVEMVRSIAEVTLEDNMMTGKKVPATFVLATNKKNEGELFANKILEFSSDTQGIKAYSMYYVNDFFEKDEEFRKASLVYLMDRKINTDGINEQSIMEGYKKKYCHSILEDKYSIIGFDIVNDMLSRENDRGELFKQIEKVQTQLSTKFKFVKAKEGGAYINSGYQVVRLK